MKTKIDLKECAVRIECLTAELINLESNMAKMEQGHHVLGNAIYFVDQPEMNDQKEKARDLLRIVIEMAKARRDLVRSQIQKIAFALHDAAYEEKAVRS